MKRTNRVLDAKSTTRAMRGSRGWRHLLTILVVVAGMASAAAFPPVATNRANAQETIAVYQSEQFDWFFFYDSSLWIIEEQSSEPGSEMLQLSNGDIIVDYWAFEAPDMTARKCVEAVLSALAADPEIAEIEALSPEGGAPVIMPPDHSGYETTVAWTELVLTIETAADHYKVATSGECRSIASEASLLLRSMIVPAAIFNEWGGFQGGEHPEIVSSDHQPTVISDGPGSSQGTLAPYFHCNEIFKVVAQNIDPKKDFVVDPSSFVAVYKMGDLAGQTVHPELREWIFPAQSPASPLVLKPGEIALFELELSPIWYTLYFETETGSLVDLGTNNGGCGAGGAAPVLIDIE
jgi:hypothetical protein